MKYLSFILFIVLFGSCSSRGIRLTVTNPSAIDRISELVEIPVEKVREQIPLRENETYLVKNKAREVIPSQVTYDGKIVFQAGLKAGETAGFYIEKGNRQNFTPLVYGRFIRERKDDFAWENDRVAFRIYGAALVPIDGPSNGLDIWYKRTSSLIIDKWYKKDLAGEASYHNDNGEGLDDYSVGRSLGAGAMAPYVNDTLYLNENFVAHEILENGPLRLTFKLVYKDLSIHGKRFGESRTFSLEAGSQLSKVRQEYGTDTAIPVAAGIVKRASNDSLVYDRDLSLLIYSEHSPKAGTAFLGLIFPDGIDSVETAHRHILTVSRYEPGKPFTYYTGYGWTKYGFPDIGNFEKYMTDFALGLKEPLMIDYKSKNYKNDE
jgi:hypothetical protein